MTIKARIDEAYQAAQARLPHNLCAVAIEETDRYGFGESMCGRDVMEDEEVIDDLEELLEAAANDDQELFDALGY